jgi:hypothetical protein
MQPRLALALVLCTTPLLMAERCGPATSLEPAYQRGLVVSDDTLPGDYLALSVEPDGKDAKSNKAWTFPSARITREDTVDGPSYVLELKGTAELKDVRLRMFLFTLGGAQYVDMVAEDTSANGRFAKSLALPQHMLFRLARPPGGGVSLDYLDAKWVDAEAARDPAGVPTRVPVRGFQKRDGALLEPSREPVLVGDTASLQKLIARAAAVPSAWSVGVELAKKGAPALRFSVTTEDRELSRDASSDSTRYAVMGSRLEIVRKSNSDVESEIAAPPTRATLTDAARIEALLRAFERTARAVPKVPVPKKDARIHRVCVQRAGAAARCVERVQGDDSGADLSAARALIEALHAQPRPSASP